MVSGATGERPKGIGQMDSEGREKLIEWIMENTSENEIFHVFSGSLANYITLRTGRLTDSGKYGLVRTEEMSEAIAKRRKSGIFIFNRKLFRVPKNLKILAEFGDFIVASL